MAITESNAAYEFDQASQSNFGVAKDFSGRGIIIAAGGPYVASAYVVVKMLRHFQVSMPIEIWYAGDDEIEPWAKKAFLDQSGVALKDIMKYTPERPLKQMRGWPIKVASIMHSSLREILFLDADCFPVCNLEFLFETPQYREFNSVFWPDYRYHKLVAGASVWQYANLPFNNDTEFETGIFLIDKVSCWRELNLTEWLNANSDFWYKHVLGDKDTFYLAWRKLSRPYFLAPACTRITSILSRHFWLQGKHLVDHRTGTSKYALPASLFGMTCFLSPYKGRPNYKNLIDEAFQRFVTKNFSLHTEFLNELLAYKL